MFFQLYLFSFSFFYFFGFPFLASGTFSTLLAQSVLSEIDPRDVALQQSLASLGQHFRPNGGQTPLSQSMAASTFGAPAKPAHKRDQEEDEEEKRHEAQTAAAVRSREKKRRAAEERRRRREELGEDEEEEEEDNAPAPVHVEDGDVSDDDPSLAEEARSKRSHAQRQAAALDTANEGTITKEEEKQWKRMGYLFRFYFYVAISHHSLVHPLLFSFFWSSSFVTFFLFSARFEGRCLLPRAGRIRHRVGSDRRDSARAASTESRSEADESHCQAAMDSFVGFESRGER